MTALLLPRATTESATTPVSKTADMVTRAALPSPTTAVAVVAGTPAKTRLSLWRSHRWQIILTIVIALVVTALTIRWWLGTAVATDAVVRRDFLQTVVASGHVEAPHRLDVAAQIVGTVLRIPVNEGQIVSAGDSLVELEAAELTASGREADVAVTQAQARLRQLREVQGPVAAQGLRQAQSSLANLRATLARNQSLFNGGFVSQTTLDDARKAVDLADADVRAAQKQLDTTGASGSDRALAVANVSGAQAGAAAARARSSYATIRAPVAGTLIARDVEVGDVVQPGKVLMTLSPQGRTQLVVAIDERSLAMLALGQPALASADAYPKQRFAAELAYINPGVNATTGAIEVKLNVVAPPAVLKQDMTVSVDIEVAHRSQVLVLPAAALHDADAAPWVYRVEGRLAIHRAVQVGLRGGGLVEVIAGLAEGDTVVVGDTGISAGARVRAAPLATAQSPATRP